MKLRDANEGIIRRAYVGAGATPEQALTAFASPESWYPVHGEKDGKPYCHWAWKGVVRPPYELAQHALREMEKGDGW